MALTVLTRDRLLRPHRRGRNCTACGQAAVDDLQQTTSKLPCVLQLQSSQLQVTGAALWQ